jgi:hypothetical protein
LRFGAPRKRFHPLKRTTSLLIPRGFLSPPDLSRRSHADAIERRRGANKQYWIIDACRNERDLDHLATVCQEKAFGLQTARRAGGPPSFELKLLDPNRGLALLPAPDAGDIFYDIEGNPRRPILAMESSIPAGSCPRLTFFRSSLFCNKLPRTPVSSSVQAGDYG